MKKSRTTDSSTISVEDTRMSKAKFQFNPDTGTMEMVKPQTPQPQQRAVQPNLKESDVPDNIDIMEARPRKPNIETNEGKVVFRELSDRDVIHIMDEKTRETACVISGYALQFSFNLQELNSVEAIESCLDGLKKLFRHKIMELMTKNIGSSK